MGVFCICWYFLSSSLSFFNDLKFSKSFTCLQRVMARYFILYETTVKGIASLIYFSIHFSFIYKRANEFFLINLVFIKFADGVTRFMRSLSELLGSLLSTIISSTNNDTVTIYFLICILCSVPAVLFL